MPSPVEVDLHLHTTHSDGTLTPRDLVSLCSERGLKTIAITDHDSTEGIPEAMATAAEIGNLEIIPGVELGADADGREVHILGYFVSHEDPELQRKLHEHRDGRVHRARAMLDKLAEIGVRISWDRIQELSGGGAIGRPHVAQAIVEAGYVQYPKDAFDRYLGRGQPAYIGRSKLTPEAAVRILIDSGAVPVMAHPTFTLSESERADLTRLKPTVHELRQAGLAGMEVHYKDYTPEQVQVLADIADEEGLIPCGGTDYHDSGNPGEPEPGSVGPPMETVYRLRALREQSRALIEHRDV